MNQENIPNKNGVVVDPTLVNADTSINPNIIICPKCGSEMKKDSRYCMKCGNLNYAHPDNESMKQYAWQNIKQGHFISGANLDNEQPLTMNNNISSVSNTNPFKTCLITNIILHLLLAGGLIFLVYSASLLSGDVPVASIFLVFVGVAIEFILNYSVQAMYIKAGEPWWSYFVPIYNNYVLYKIAFGNGWMFLTMLIPVIGQIISLVAFYKIGRKFYKNGWLTLFFPFVMIPIIAFDKNAEFSMLARAVNVSASDIDINGKTQSEKEYGRKKFVITTIIVILLAVGLYFAWPYLPPLFEKLYEFFMEQLEFFK